MPWHLNQRFEVGGTIVPAYDIAGDAFDFSVDADGAHVGLFDAVGHGLRATLIASTVIGAFRRGRLVADALVHVAQSIEEALSVILDPGEFVTGIVMRYDTHLRKLEFCNAGHPPPVLVRGGRARQLLAPASLPFGLGGAPSVESFQLERGDLVAICTDGVIQARNPRREMLGDDAVAAQLAANARESLPELCRKVLGFVETHVQRPLSDDASIVVLRVTEAG
jgi:serine phosphatase RsbU (regulator of sigma subunit)